MSYAGVALVNSIWQLLVARDCPEPLGIILSLFLFGIPFGPLLQFFLLGAIADYAWRMSSGRLHAWFVTKSGGYRMQFRFEHLVMMPIETVFAFHEDPANLARLLRNWRGFKILHHGGNIRPGSETWVEQTVLSCFPVVMGFRHTIYEPPTRFAEQMIHGPFHQFDHIHEFESTPQGIVVRDLLDVAWPWQYGGEFVMRFCVAPMLRRVFEFRQRVLEQLLDENTSDQCSQRLAER